MALNIEFFVAVVTIIGGLATNRYLDYLREIDKKEKLRSAIKAEILAIQGSYKWLGEGIEANVWRGYFPTTVFDANANELGLLEEDEIENIVNYYSTIHAYENEVDMIRQYGASDPQSQLEHHSNLDQRVHGLITNKIWALESIESHTRHNSQRYELASWMQNYDREILQCLASPENELHTAEVVSDCASFEADFTKERLNRFVDQGICQTDQRDGKVVYQLTLHGGAYLAGEINASRFE